MTTVHAINAAFLARKFEGGLTYDDYLATDPEKAAPWRAIHEQVALNASQRELLGRFTRSVKILALSGIWCGDCVQQGPLVQIIAQATPVIEVRWLDRDEHADLSDAVMINAGRRVPMFIFMAEDHEPVSIIGDRTVSRYRAMAARSLGPSCPVPGAPISDDELAATLQDYLDEVERVHLLLRLSGRLRTKHGD